MLPRKDLNSIPLERRRNVNASGATTS